MCLLNNMKILPLNRSDEVNKSPVILDGASSGSEVTEECIPSMCEGETSDWRLDCNKSWK